MSLRCSLEIQPFGLSVHLLDPTPRGENARRELAAASVLVQVAGGVSFCGSVGVALTGFFLSRRYPIAGTLTGVTAAASALVSRDVYLVGKNSYQIMSGNIIERTKSASNARNFVQALTKKTLFIGPLFGSTMVMKLNQKGPFTS